MGTAGEPRRTHGHRRSGILTLVEMSRRPEDVPVLVWLIGAILGFMCAFASAFARNWVGLAAGLLMIMYFLWRAMATRRRDIR